MAKQLAELGCRRVSLIGGEVFMRKDWAEITRALTERGISTAIITNGFAFSPEMIRQLKDVNIESVAVSLDGTREIHDALRQQGSYDRALKAIDDLSRADILVSVITTLNSENIDSLDEMYTILSGKKIFAWQLQACSPMGNAVDTGIDYRFDHRKAVEFTEKHLSDPGMVIGVADNIGYFSKSEGYIRGNKSGGGIYRGCRAGLMSIGIDSTGNVRGCESMYDEQFNEGNLRSRTLRDIWEDPEAFSYNRGFSTDMLNGKCSGCRYGSICAGGCRSYNYFTGGDMYSHLDCILHEESD